MRSLRSTVLALLIGSVLVGCSDDPTSTTTDASASTTTPSEPSSATGSQPANAAEAIPDGNYAKTVTVAQAKSMGITDQGFLKELGKDGKTTYVIKFAGDRWTIFVVEGAPEPGDLGTLAYDPNANVVMTSESEGCDCIYAYDWSLVGDQLTLELVGHDSTDTPEGVVIVRFVTEGTFTRQS